MKLPSAWLLLLVAGMIASGASSSLAEAGAVKAPDFLLPLHGKGLVVKIEGTDTPEGAAWAQRAKEMVELWFPIVATYLDTPGWKAPQEITLEFKEMKGVAHAGGNRITISKAWIKHHPEDIGMVLHEMVHIIQAYPPQKDHWWLIEGVADYIRFWQAEPAGQPKIARGKNHYKQGYRVTGAFLAWVRAERAPLIIQEVNFALRRGVYSDKLFREKTGKDLETLWTEFLSSLEAVPK